MIQYGMRLHDVCPKGSAETVLDQAQEMGLHYIQLAMSKSFSEPDTSPGNYSDGLGAYLGEALRKRNLRAAILGCYINPANPDEEKRQEEIRRFIEHLKYAKQMNADLVGTETGRYSLNMEITEETYTERCYLRVLDSFQRIREAAEKLGIRVGIEGVYNHTLHTPELMARFLSDIDSPNFDVILDAVNIITPETRLSPEAQNDIIRRCFTLFGERISVLHLKDGDFTEDRQQLFCHPGDGIFCYEELMRQIAARKPYIVGLLENSSKERFHEDCRYLEEQYRRYGGESRTGGRMDR